jgi:UDP-3-O-[3-hydroxymyristoyl] glucosamine N-acyltransferase
MIRKKKNIISSKIFFSFFSLKKKKPFLPFKIIKLKSLNEAKKNDITFFSNVKYLEDLKKTKASAIFVQKKFVKYLPEKCMPIISTYPEIDFAKTANFIYPESYHSKILNINISEKEIEKKYKNLTFGKNFYLERNVSIGSKAFIGNNVTIKANCVIGNNVVIGSNVVIESTVIGNNTYICDGCIVGKKGFGFKFVNGRCLRIPHLGKVLIGNDCEIGANSVIDRGSVKNTIIGDNTFVDNLVHIAHNVTIGKRCIIAGQVGIAGSVSIGNYVTIGGQAGISGHLRIGNNVKVGGKSGVVKNIKDNQVVMGYPAKALRDFLKDNR